MDLKRIRELSGVLNEAVAQRGPFDALSAGEMTDAANALNYAAGEIARLTGVLRRIQFAERSENIHTIIIAAIGPAEGDPS